jgi:hypothetical protein
VLRFSQQPSRVFPQLDIQIFTVGVDHFRTPLSLDLSLFGKPSGLFITAAA